MYANRAAAGLVAVALGSLLSCGGADVTQLPADQIFLNGKVYTAAASAPWAEAVAVRGADIVYVGDQTGVDAFRGADTAVTDLGGKVMLPGLISTHDHATGLMQFSGGLVMPNNGDPEWMLEQLEQYIADNPDGPYYSYGGAFEGMVEITREQIDAIVPDKPFLMIGQGGHGGWANSLAIEGAGVTRDVPDPIDAWGRHPDGTPTGELAASPAVFWTVRELDLVQKDAIIAQAPGILRDLSSKGVSASYEVMVFPGTEATVFDAISELENNGDLSVRLFMCTAIQRPVHIESALEALNTFGPRYSSEFFNVNTLKIHGDGAFENRTARVLDHYPDQPDNFGFLAMTQEQVVDTMLRAAEAGYNIHTHTVGDAAARWALDGFEAVRQAGYDEVRLATGHTMLVDEADKPRFAELNVSVNTLSPQTIPTEAAKAALDTERYERMMPLGTLAAQGARIGASADYPVFDINPFANMYMMVTRTAVGDDEMLPPEADRISLEQALRAYTIDAAYMMGADNFIGSIEVGKRADLVVVDRDIFEVDIEELPAVTVLQTIVNGETVFER